MKVEGLKNEGIVAVAKLVSAKEMAEANKELVAGEYDVDFTLRVKGTIKRGENYTQQVSAKADPWLLLGAALSHLNSVTIDSIVREALEQDPELVDSLKAKAAEAIAQIKGTTETECNGKTTAKLTVEVI